MLAKVLGENLQLLIRPDRTLKTNGIAVAIWDKGHQPDPLVLMRKLRTTYTQEFHVLGHLQYGDYISLPYMMAALPITDIDRFYFYLKTAYGQQLFQELNDWEPLYESLGQVVDALASQSADILSNTSAKPPKNVTAIYNQLGW